MIQARIKPSKYVGYPITACSGMEFVNYAWRPVPAGYEAEAERNEFLETRSMVEEEKESPAPVKKAKKAKLPDTTVLVLEEKEGGTLDVQL